MRAALKMYYKNLFNLNTESAKFCWGQISFNLFKWRELMDYSVKASALRSVSCGASQVRFRIPSVTFYQNIWRRKIAVYPLFTPTLMVRGNSTIR